MPKLSIPDCVIEAVFDRPTELEPTREVTIPIDVYEWRVKWDKQLSINSDPEKVVEWFQDAFVARYEPIYSGDSILSFSEAYNLLQAIAAAFEEFKKKFAVIRTSCFGTDSPTPSS